MTYNYKYWTQLQGMEINLIFLERKCALYVQLWDRGINLSLLRVVTIYLIFHWTRKQSDYPQHVRWKQLSGYIALLQGFNWKGGRKRNLDLGVMFRANVLRWSVPHWLADGTHHHLFLMKKEICGEMGSQSRNPSQTRETGCVNFLFLSRIRLREYSLVLLTLSWFNLKKNQKVTLSLNTDSWPLLFVSLAMSLECLILAADLWIPTTLCT